LRSCGRSPPWWVGWHGRSDRQHEIIVEWEALTGNFPVLMKINYYDWTALMRVMLQAQGMWNMVTEGALDYTVDRMALSVIA
jgi:hypothetical protein